MFKKQNNNRSRTNYRSVNTNFRTGNAAPSSSQRTSRAQAEIKTARQEKLTSKMGRHKKILRLYLVCLVVLIALSAARFSVNNVSIKTTVSIPDNLKSQYSNFLLSSVSNHSIFNQSWSLSKQEVEDEIKSKYPEVQAAELKSFNPMSTSMKATLQFRKPAFLWQDVSRQQRFVDDRGVLFSNNYSDAKLKDLIIIQDDSGLVLDSGNTAVGRTTAKIIGELPSKLTTVKVVGSKKTGIDKVVIPKSTRELRVYPKGAGYFVKITTSRGVEDQIKELDSLMKYLAGKKIIPSQYVDVRLEGKAFYK